MTYSNCLYSVMFVLFCNMLVVTLIAMFLSCRTDRQNRQQPIQGILLKVTIQNFKESPCKSSSIFLYCFASEYFELVH